MPIIFLEKNQQVMEFLLSKNIPFSVSSNGVIKCEANDDDVSHVVSIDAKGTAMIFNSSLTNSELIDKLSAQRAKLSSELDQTQSAIANIIATINRIAESMKFIDNALFAVQIFKGEESFSEISKAMLGAFVIGDAELSTVDESIFNILVQKEAELGKGSAVLCKHDSMGYFVVNIKTSEILWKQNSQ